MDRAQKATGWVTVAGEANCVKREAMVKLSEVAAVGVHISADAEAWRRESNTYATIYLRSGDSIDVTPEMARDVAAALRAWVDGGE